MKYNVDVLDLPIICIFISLFSLSSDFTLNMGHYLQNTCISFMVRVLILSILVKDRESS